MRDRSTYAAVMAATAVGDALGYLVERIWPDPREEWFTSLGEYLEWAGYDGGEIKYSDDTEMATFLAETLIEACGFDPDLFMRKAAERAMLLERYYGNGTSKVIEAVREGTHWSVASRAAFGGRGNMGNGAAMRVAPIALFYRRREEVEYFAEAQAVVTHAHPVAIEGARLVALAIHYSLKGMGPDELLEKLVEETQHPHYVGKLKAIKHLLSAPPTKVAAALGNDATADESVPAAIYAHVRGDGEPLETLLTALSLGGDTDTIAAMALPISAAYAGDLGKIPGEVVSRVEAIQEIFSLGENLHKASSACGSRS